MYHLKKVRKPMGELKFFTRSDQDGEKVYDRFGRLKGFTDGKDTFDKSDRRVCLGFQPASLFDDNDNETP